LEQCFPNHEGDLPIGREQLVELFKVFKIPEPIFGRKEYSFEHFLNELVRPNQNLRSST
jgi:hypothetical protein